MTALGALPLLLGIAASAPTDAHAQTLLGRVLDQVTETPVDGTPEPATTSQPTATPQPGTEDANGDGIPLWGLIVGIAAATIVAGGAGLAIGRSAAR